MSKFLIVNGDDFGSCRAVNKGIQLAYEKGILTSTSLMAGGKAFDEAVEIAKDHPNMGVGIHLTLVLGRAVLPAKKIKGLVNREGNFTNNPVLGGMRYFFSKSLQSTISIEIEAQIEKFLNTGLKPTHVDGHLNIHLHPTVLDLLLPVLDKYNIRAMRVPKENLMLHLRFNKNRFLSIAVHAVIFSLLSQRAKVLLCHKHIRFPDQTFGLLQSGSMTQDFLETVLPQLPDGVTEMGFHVAKGEVDKEASVSGYRYGEELSALMDPEIKELVKQNGIQLINYGHFTDSV